MVKIDRTLMILATLLSFFLWLYVHVMLGAPEKVRVVNDVPVTPLNNLPAGYLYQLHKDNRNVTVKLMGPEGMVDAIVRDDLIANIDLTKVPLNFQKVTGQTVATMPITMKKLPPGVRLVESPKVTLIVYPQSRREFPITVAFVPPPPPGTTVGQFLVEPATVLVEGAQVDVDAVEYVTVSINPNKRFTADRNLIPVPVDSEGRPVSGVSVSHPTVMVHMASPTGTPD